MSIMCKKGKTISSFNENSVMIPDVFKIILNYVIMNKSNYIAAVLVCRQWRDFIYQMVEDKIQKNSRFC